MSILTVDEMWAACPEAKSERELYDFASGVCVALERATNRAIARRAVNATAASGVATVTVPRHGWRTGQSVRVVALNADAFWDGVFVIIGTPDVDTLTFAITGVASPDAAIELSLRPVRVATLQTRGGSSLFLDPRPLGEVLSVELGAGDGTFSDPLLATQHGLGDVIGGVSLTGELVLYSQTFPERVGDYRGGRYVNAGVRVAYVSGEEVAPPDLVYACGRAMATVWSRSRKKNADFKSESYDYYSYSRMSRGELAELFGEVESIIFSYRLAVI